MNLDLIYVPDIPHKTRCSILVDLNDKIQEEIPELSLEVYKLNYGKSSTDLSEIFRLGFYEMWDTIRLELSGEM